MELFCIENKTYEKTLTNQTNFDGALSEEIRNQAKLAVKDEYTFAFLELADAHSERQLEQEIYQIVSTVLPELEGQLPGPEQVAKLLEDAY